VCVCVCVCVCVNNNVKNDCFEFPKVKWLHLTGEVDKSVTCSCQIFSGFNVPKITKNGLTFNTVIPKIIRWTFFGDTWYNGRLIGCVLSNGNNTTDQKGP